MVQCRGETGVQGTATSSVATLDVLRGNLEKTFFGLFRGESAKVTLLLGGLLGGGGGGAINGGGGGVGNEIAGDSPAELSE